MLHAGIVDPAKVVRAALQGAASVAGLLITTEAMIARHREKMTRRMCRVVVGGMGGMDYGGSVRGQGKGPDQRGRRPSLCRRERSLRAAYS